MTLKELQQMIKEEFDALQMEADDVDVSVSDDDVDAMGDDSSEDMLRKIYDMLKDKFEAEEEGDMDEAEDMEEAEMEEMSDMEEEMVGEVKDDEKKDEAADMEEFVQPSNTKSHGPNVGMKPAKTTRGDGKLHESVKRFQKLANIIK